MKVLKAFRLIYDMMGLSHTSLAVPYGKDAKTEWTEAMALEAQQAMEYTVGCPTSLQRIYEERETVKASDLRPGWRFGNPGSFHYDDRIFHFVDTAFLDGEMIGWNYAADVKPDEKGNRRLTVLND